MSEIGDVFAIDPLKLTNEDLTKVITHFRSARAMFMQAGTRVKTETKEPKEKKAKITGLSLGDLKLT